MKLADANPGDIVFLSERFGDEIRETFYIREDGRDVRHRHHVPVAALGFVQAEPGAEHLRVVRIWDKPHRDPGEADGRVAVQAVIDGASHFAALLKLSGG